MYALKSIGGKLYAACEVTVGGGLTVSVFDGTSWSSVDGGVTFGAGYAIASYRTELEVGGAFTAAQSGEVQTSGLARYRIQGLPWIVHQPAASQVAACHSNPIINVDLCTGYEDVVQFQWLKNGIPLTEGWTRTGSSLVGAATSEDLQLLDVSDADEGTYQLQISTSCGSVTSIAVTLDVTGACPPCPFDIAPQPVGNGQIDVDDLLYVINHWGNCPLPPVKCPADVTPSAGNGVVNVDDLLAIINHWGVCP